MKITLIISFKVFKYFKRLSRIIFQTDSRELFKNVIEFDTRKYGHIFNHRTSPNIKSGQHDLAEV